MKRKAFVMGVLLMAALAVSALAQEELGLSLRLSRDFGSGFGSRIQGTFSMRVDGPEDLERVEFYIDDQRMGEDATPPFRWQFRTNDYEPGIHRLSAVGYTGDGRELRSTTLTREFLSGSESGKLTIYLVAGLAVLIVGGRLLSSWIANRGQKVRDRPATSGPLGGAICPNCGRPFAIHFWGINLLAGRLDRCPYCGKWRLVRRASAQALQAAAESFEMEEASAPAVHPLSEEERLRRQLDDSRFEDVGGS